ncbi:MAG TPA: DsbC family protein [Casimicrobiaceae bacterium]|nr:DsbC family protein [Casimicrobiaceae bacterium]
MMTLRHMVVATLTTVALSAGPAVLAQGIPKPTSMTPDAVAVKKLLEERFPGAQVKYIAKSPYFGLYEAMFDDQMMYVDPKVHYVFIGNIYDTKTKTNLTEQKTRQINRIAWSELPLNLAIKKVKGNGSRRVAVFSDADCPFCARLEETLKNVNDVTIYTFLYPIDALHPDAARKSRAIWCSPDRVKSWDEFFVSGKVPENAGDCDNPVAATMALGQKLRVSATPTLVFADGTIVPGAVPAATIEAELNRAEAEAKKLAQSK